MDFHMYIISIIFWCTIYKVTANDFHCKSTDSCLCTTIRTYYEYQCPLEEPNIVVKVYPNYGINVQCLSDIVWAEQNLPQVNFGNAEAFMFRTCPMPNNISRLINSFGINELKELQFDFTKLSNNFTFTSEIFSGLSYLNKLILSNNQIENIDENAFKYLTNLTEMDLSSNALKLTPNLFSFSEKLVLLDLSLNDLKYIPDKLFQNLRHLKTLFLWSNNFKTINSGVFKNLANLKTLELSNCHIQVLPGEIFYSLTDLRAINLAMNELDTVPANIFSRNSHLEIIKMERNIFLRSIPDYLFSNLTYLKTVELFECKLTTLPENVFFGCIHLENISLKHNELTELPENLLQGLTELENLNLSNNKLQFLSESIFLSLSKLTTLDLSNNQLIKIGSTLFSRLLKLEKINLSNNRLISLHRHSFEQLIMLREMVLSHNYLSLNENDTNVSRFNNNLKLEHVDLSYNNITGINEDWLISKVYLHELDFSYNQIEYLNFNYLLSVSHKLVINLSHNKIKVVNFTDAEDLARSQGNLDAYTSNAANRIVYLEGNPISCDCRIYDFIRYFDRSIDPMVPTLVTVKADNLICHSPVDFYGSLVKDLKPKMLTCGLSQVERNASCPDNCFCAVRPWNKAFIVNCNNQNLTTIPKLVFPKSNIYNHTVVNLKNNLITSGPAINMGYENVTVLDLSSNYINKFKWVPPKMKSLNLEHNNLSFLNYHVLEMLNTSRLADIFLGDNPWRCDCQTGNLSNFLVTHLPQQQIDVKNIKCAHSEELVVQLNINELCPNYQMLTINLSIGVAILALIFAAITVFYYRYELEIKVWLYAHNMLLWLISEEEIDKDKVYDAFISYSHEDEDFLMNNLLPGLEQGAKPYKLCIHIRDWIAGEFIPTQIVNSVKQSRRTIVILSQNFLQSNWGKMEFNIAHAEAVADGRHRVIIILYGNVNLETDLSDELKAYIKTNTYVKWDDHWFWYKLRYALPHSKIKVGRKSQNVMLNLNDKLDLLNNTPSTPNANSTPPILSEPPLLIKDHSVNFRNNIALTPPAESGLKPLLITRDK